MSARTIHLVRHGRSAHAATAWVDHAGLVRWFEAYDAAGIADNEAPPPAVRNINRFVVASDMPRAIESARLLDTAFRTSPLLREAQLIFPRLGGLRWPRLIWGVAIGIRWLIAIRKGQWPFADDYQRGEEAAAWLDALSKKHATITVVTHVAFRRILSAGLVRRGWRSEGKRKSHHWSVRTLTRA